MEHSPEKTRMPRPRRFRPLKILPAVLILLSLSVGGMLRNLSPKIVSVRAAEEPNADYTVTVSVEAKNRGDNLYYDTYCLVSDRQYTPSPTDPGWVKMEGGRHSFDAGNGSFYVFAMDARGNISRADEQTVEVQIDEVVSVSIPREMSYLPEGGRQLLSAELVSVGEPDDRVTWSSSDSAVASVDETGLVTGHSGGSAVITASVPNGLSDTSEVLVTDCIIVPGNHYKEFISNDYYTPEEAALMDEILFSRVEDAGGYGTRGAVVAAARFLTLELPVMIPYFYENGRMDPNPGRPQCDGEGRYYHLGLYLDDSKYAEIETAVAGPAHWGAPLTNFQDEGYFSSGGRYPNGLSCSGFVCWALFNGGLDVGDVGAGDYPEIDSDLSDLNEMLPLTVELLRSGSVRVGDLIGKDGHIALVVGLDDEMISIAESYFRGVQVVEFTIDRGANGVIDSDEYHYVIQMEDYYTGDGVYSDTWQTE